MPIDKEAADMQKAIELAEEIIEYRLKELERDFVTPLGYTIESVEWNGKRIDIKVKKD